MSSLLQDIRFAFRMMVRNPGVTVISILALALGIGANTAIFSAVSGVLLRPLPYPDPDQLAMAFSTQPFLSRSPVSALDLRDWRQQNQSFSDLASFSYWDFNVSGTGDPEYLSGFRVSASFFRVLRVEPVLGRSFQAEEEQPGRGQVAIMSHELLGRLKDGVSLAQADLELKTIASRLAKEYPDSNRDVGAKVVSLHAQMVGNSRAALLALLGATAFVLLIACANVANLLLARSAARQTEIAIRLALGASRRRIIRQLLTESACLALLGGSLGVLVALWGVDLLALGLSQSLYPFMQVALDPRVLIFCLVLSTLTGLVFGLGPALQATTPNLYEHLKEGASRSTSGGQRHRLRNLLVVSEIALSLTLLIGAGLMIRSLVHLQQVKLGFNPANVLAMRLTLPGASYETSEQAARFQEQLLARVQALPGVTAAGITNNLPLTWRQASGPFEIEGRPPWPGKRPLTEYLYASPSYFRAMGIQLVAGRVFSDRDRQDAPRVAVINRTMAERFWSGDTAIGKRIHIGWAGEGFAEIIGVVEDTKRGGFVGMAPRAESYFSYLQHTDRLLALVVRSAVDPKSLVSAIKGEVQALDANQPVFDVQPMEQLVSASLTETRFQTVLFLIFALIAILLAVIGIYGVMSYNVQQRTREIGIRMALGAEARQVRSLVVKQGLRLTLAGVLIGVFTAYGASQLIAKLLYGVTATDPATFVATSVLLGLVAVIASYLPARRATQIDPMIALRHE